MEPTTLHFPLNLTIDRTDAGYRATLPSSPPEAIEAPSLPELLVILKEKLARIMQAMEDFDDLRTIRDGLEDVKANGLVPWEQLKAELGI